MSNLKAVQMLCSDHPILASSYLKQRILPGKDRSKIVQTIAEFLCQISLLSKNFLDKPKIIIESDDFTTPFLNSFGLGSLTLCLMLEPITIGVDVIFRCYCMVLIMLMIYSYGSTSGVNLDPMQKGILSLLF